MMKEWRVCARPDAKALAPQNRRRRRSRPPPRWTLSGADAVVVASGASSKATSTVAAAVVVPARQEVPRSPSQPRPPPFVRTLRVPPPRVRSTFPRVCAQSRRRLPWRVPAVRRGRLPRGRRARARGAHLRRACTPSAPACAPECAARAADGGAQLSGCVSGTGHAPARGTFGSRGIFGSPPRRIFCFCFWEGVPRIASAPRPRPEP